MPSIRTPTSTQLNAALEAGLDTLDLNQEITFTKFIKVVLPYDGFVFWVKADQVSPGTLYNASAYNQRFYNEPTAIVTPASTIKVQGSMHYITDNRQEEADTVAVNRMRFAAKDPINDLNEVSPMVLWVGEFEGQKFAFTTRRNFYQQAGLYHYEGDAVYPYMATQLVDDVRSFNSKDPIVSNSLPAWLALNLASATARPGRAALGAVPMFPSYLVADNIEPPFIAVHIGDEDTEALQSAPLIMADSSHYQLAQDTVRITTYGMRNNEILDWMDFVNQYSLDTDIIGIMNMPIIRDAKSMQSELNTLAIKKVVEFEVSYYQTRVTDVARQLIESAFITFNVKE